jgi:hypothetical protein
MSIIATHAPGNAPTRSYLKYAAMGVLIASIIFGSLLIHFSAAASTTAYVGIAFIVIPLYLLYLSHIGRQLVKEDQMLRAAQRPMSVVLAQPVLNVPEPGLNVLEPGLNVLEPVSNVSARAPVVVIQGTTPSPEDGRNALTVVASSVSEPVSSSR